MHINKKLDNFLNSSLLSTSIFIGNGVYKTYKDYQNADDKYKSKFLIKDSVVLSGAALGLLGYNTAAKKIVNHSNFKNISDRITHYLTNKTKIIEKPVKYVREITNDLMSSFLLCASGILGALGMDFLLSKTGFEQPENNPDAYEKSRFAAYIDNNIMKDVDENTRDIMYSRITDMPQMRIFTTGMIGTQAIDLAKNKEFDKRLKYTTECLINDTLIPIAILSTASALTKSIKALYRIPIIFASLVGGTMLTNKLLQYYIKDDGN